MVGNIECKGTALSQVYIGGAACRINQMQYLVGGEEKMWSRIPIGFMNARVPGEKRPSLHCLGNADTSR